MDKPIVHYPLHHANYIHVGESALVMPIDHTSVFVSNTTWSATGTVLKYSDVDHIFETENTMYVGVKPT